MSLNHGQSTHEACGNLTGEKDKDGKDIACKCQRFKTVCKETSAHGKTYKCRACGKVTEKPISLGVLAKALAEEPAKAEQPEVATAAVATE